MRLLLALLAGPAGLAGLAGLAGPVAPAAAQVQTAFCLSAVQTASSAGPCPGCALVIDLDVQETAGAYENAYRIRANNGWTATATETADPAVLAGTGTWGPGLGAWSNRPFDLILRAGGAGFTAALRHEPAFGTLTAEYACR